MNQILDQLPKRKKRGPLTPEQRERKNARRRVADRSKRSEEREAIPKSGWVPYFRNSRSHVALSYMKVFPGWTNYYELCEFSPIFKPTRESRTSFTRDMKRLADLGHLEFRYPEKGKGTKGDVSSFRILPLGIVYLYSSAALWMESHPLEDDD